MGNEGFKHRGLATAGDPMQQEYLGDPAVDLGCHRIIHLLLLVTEPDLGRIPPLLRSTLHRTELLHIVLLHQSMLQQGLHHCRSHTAQIACLPDGNRAVFLQQCQHLPLLGGGLMPVLPCKVCVRQADHLDVLIPHRLG